MAQLHGQGPVSTASDTSIIDLTTAATKVGTRAKDSAGNEYIYLKGVGSTVAGSVVIYDSTYATTLLPAAGSTCFGPVAVAMAAVNATTSWGWYQIFGMATAVAQTAGIRSQLYPATSGSASNVGTIGDTYQAAAQIHGVGSMSSTTGNAGTNTVTVFLQYPWVNNKSDS